MKTLEWDEIRANYGIDVRKLREEDPALTCGVVSRKGVYWRTLAESIHVDSERLLLEILAAADQPELLYLRFAPGAPPESATPGEITEAARALSAENRMVWLTGGDPYGHQLIYTRRSA